MDKKLYFSPSEQAQLSSLGIQAAILFGSHAVGNTHPQSDYDIAVIGPKSEVSYDTLYDLLSRKIQKLVNIDIVFLHTAPMDLRMHVARHGLPIYQPSPAVFADFKQQTMAKYADFAPLRAIFSNATLSRISP